MNSSQRKQFIAWVKAANAAGQMLEFVDTLLILMKKFGKQLSQTPIKEFVQQNYPEAYGLYSLMGGVRSTVKDCLLLKQDLYSLVGEKSLLVQSSDRESLQDLSTHESLTFVSDAQEGGPSLRIQSPREIYSRSLSQDLEKLL